MPLKVIVIGAGIAGLCTATSLRQAGHSVQIFEKSSFAAATGAALALAPNGARVLSGLGFSFDRARACRMQVWETCNGTTLERISSVSLEDAQERFGAFLWAVHRIDLHDELLRLALEGHGAATLRLNAGVVKVSSEAGTVELSDGSSHQADLVVAADGLHSIVRTMVTGEQATSVGTSMSAFRFLLPTELLQRNPELCELLDWKARGASILADIADTLNERHMVWYDCQSGEVQNFVGIHPTRSSGDGAVPDEKTAMLQEFAHFHPKLIEIIMLAENVKCWPLFAYDPLPTWVYGKVVLLGDAAHPMLPFGGQGSNQAIEDGGALGYLLQNVSDAATIAERLKVFEAVRKDRASRVQILSGVRAGKEIEVEEKLWRYAGNMTSVPTSFSERISHDYGFDVLADCAKKMELSDQNNPRIPATVFIMSSKSQKSPSRPTAASKHDAYLQKRYGKQQHRRTRSGVLPSPALNIPLDSYTSFVTHLQSSNRIMALLGAGISAASGIPTFRGPGGFWREHNAMDLATPEAFFKDPGLVWQFYNYRRHMALRAAPNKAHLALAKLAEKRPEFLAISQNIDGLSQRANHPASNLEAVHGSLFDIRCSSSQCASAKKDDFTDPVVPALAISEDHDLSSTKFPLKSIARSDLPRCPKCQSLLRPGVVWFGEPLPMRAIDRIHNWLDGGKVDLILVIGTSATVWPAANYIHAARVAGARVAVFNMESPDTDDGFGEAREEDWFFRGDAGDLVPELMKEVIGVVTKKTMK